MNLHNIKCDNTKRIKVTLFFFLFVFFAFNNSFFTQILDNRTGKAFTEHPFFNEDFIKKNKIKEMGAIVSYKKQGGALKKTKLSYTFFFDEMGRLIHTIETNYRGHTIDTIENFYFYENNRISIHRKKEMNGYTSTHWKYNENGNPVLMEFHRDVIDVQKNVVKSVVLYSKMLSSEITYYNKENSTSTKTYKRTIFNNYDLPYKEIIFKYSEDGYLLEEIEKLKMKSIFFKKTYEYNQNGWISEIKNFNSNSAKASEKWTYKYDDFGNLTKLDYYRGNNLIEEKEVYYSDQTKLIGNMLVIKNQEFKIMQFKNIKYYE